MCNLVENVVVRVVPEEGLVGFSPCGAQGLSGPEGAPGEGPREVMVSRPRPAGSRTSLLRTRKGVGHVCQPYLLITREGPGEDSGRLADFWRKKEKKRKDCFCL